MKTIDLSLYLVTDDRIPWQRCLSITKDVVNAQSGVTAIQLRDKVSPTSLVKDHALELQNYLQPFGIPLIINDYVDLVHEIGATGVHLGRDDCPVTVAREILGPDVIIGLSLNRLEDFDPTSCGKCDYIAASPVFKTKTKDNAAAAWGLENLRRLRARSVLPIVAIGGIREEHIKEIAEIGVEGVAVVSAIYADQNPPLAARRLRRIFQACQK